MKDILEEMGLTLSEVIGAAMVFVGFAGATALLAKYGYYFVQALVG